METIKLVHLCEIYGGNLDLSRLPYKPRHDSHIHHASKVKHKLVIDMLFFSAK